MVDDSELDYLRTFFRKVCLQSTVGHFSEIKKIDSLNNTRRVLIYPPELMNIDGKFYNKRYKLQLSSDSEANLMETFNRIVEGIQNLQRGNTVGALSAGVSTNYDGTYGFIDDDAGDEPAGWTVVETNGIIEVVAEKDEHLKVVSLTKTGGTIVYMTISFTGQLTGTIEFWEYPDASGSDSWFEFQNGSGFMGAFHFGDAGYGGNAGKPFWFDGSDDSQLIASDLRDQWNHIKIFFTGNDITSTINGTEGLNQPDHFTGGETTPIIIKISTQQSQKDYYDAIGLSWDSDYEVGDNTYLYTRETTLIYMTLAYGNRAYEVGSTKRWYQDIYLDVEWSTE